MRFAVNLWPAAFDIGKLEEIELIISSYGSIIEKKERVFTYEELRRYLIEIYRGERWAGWPWNGYKGIYGKLDPCFREGVSTCLLLVECDSLEKVNQMKKKIRTYCQRDKSSVHTSDNRRETEKLLRAWDNCI